MGSVETLSPAEELPALFRAVLDGVAELERLGERREAGRVRAEAVRAYSRSWDASGRRRLEGILRRAERAVAETRRSGPERATRRVTSPL
jgi:hypothetical protein